MNPVNQRPVTQMPGRKDSATEQSSDQPGCGAACDYVVQRITELGALSPLEVPKRREQMPSRPPYSSFDPMTVEG